MTDEDSKKDSTFHPNPIIKPGLSKIAATEPEQKTEKPELSIPPKLEGISEQFKKGYDEGYNEGYKDAKDGKPKRKFK